MGPRVLTLALTFVCAAQAAAQTPHSRTDCGLGSWFRCPSLGCCVDDYCRKTSPIISPLPRCGGQDDYCRKTMPCLTDINRCGGCDDYCRKTMPTLLCPPWSPALQCGPGECRPTGRMRFVSPPLTGR